MPRKAHVFPVSVVLAFAALCGCGSQPGGKPSPSASAIQPAPSTQAASPTPSTVDAGVQLKQWLDTINQYNQGQNGVTADQCQQAYDGYTAVNQLIVPDLYGLPHNPPKCKGPTTS